MQEELIIQQCIEGNAKAQRALVDMHSKYLYNLCLRYTRDVVLAKDCLQESWILIILNIKSYKAGTNFKGWITTLAVRKTLKVIKKYHNLNWQEVDHVDQPKEDSNVYYKLELDDVERFIESLDQKYQIVIQMYLVEGFSHKEIAEVMGVQEAHSRILLSRAKKMIQENFESVAKYEVRSAVKAMIMITPVKSQLSLVS